MGGIGCSIANPVRGDLNRWGAIRMNRGGHQRGHEEDHDAQRHKFTAGLHGNVVMPLPFKTLGTMCSLKVKNITKQQGENNGCVALNVEFRRFNSKFAPTDLLVWWSAGISSK